MRARIAFFLLAIACLLQAGPALAQMEEAGAEQFDTERAEAVRLEPAEKIRLLAIVNAQPLSGWSRDELLQFHKQQYEAAAKLQDVRLTERALRHWIAAGPGQDDSIDARWALANLLITVGNRSEGLALAEAVASETTRIIKKTIFLATLSRHYLDQFDIARAKQLQDEAFFLLRQRGPLIKRTPETVFSLKRAEAIVYLAKCALLRHEGKFDAMLDASRRALALAHEAHDMGQDLGSIEKSRSEQTDLIALRFLLSSLVLNSRLYEAETVAYELLQKSDQYHEPPNTRARGFLMLADLRIAQGKFQEALKAVAKVNAIGKQAGFSEGSAVMVLAKGRMINALTGLQKWQDVRQTFLAADSVSNDAANAKLLTAYSLSRGLSLLYGGEAERAASVFQTAYETRISSHGRTHFFTAQAAGFYAMALYKQGKVEQARRLFSEAARDLLNAENAEGDVDAGGGLNKLYRRLILEAYLELLTSGSGQGDSSLNEAYVLADYLRSSIVQQSVVDSALRSAASVAGLGDLVRRAQDNKNEIATLYSFLAKQLAEPTERRLPKVMEDMRRRITELESENKSLHRKIAQGFPEYDKLVNPQPPGVAETAKRLADGEVLVSILPAGEHTYVWLVRSDGRLAFHRATLSAAQIDQLVKRLRASLDIGELSPNAIPPFDAAAAQQLYQTLLAPMSDAMRGARHLIVSTGGSLGQIPFAVLLTAAPLKGNLRDQPWLIKQAAISHVPSVSAWVALKQGAHASTAQRHPFIGFGDPLFALGSVPKQNEGAAIRKVNMTRAVTADPEQALVSTLTYSRLPPLPETRDEIMAIAKAMKADPQRDAFFGREASRNTVLKTPLADRQVIVFATHGLIAGDLPNLNQPALALAATGNDNESPLLTLEDVLNLKLDADWVVLSACNTAAADGQVGEAISGLGRGFFYAGSRALLVTHWAVESQSAKDLTTATFRRFGSDPTLPRAEALRQAQLEVMKKESYGHPFYWAPYALVGDGGR